METATEVRIQAQQQAGTQGVSLVAKVANRYGVDPAKLLGTLKATAFRQEEGREVTNEQMMALLVVADQYKLNPFTKEIYAFFDKNKGVVPIVGVDGFARIISEHPQCDGFEFRDSPEIVQSAEHKPCPAWMEMVVYRKDRTHPIVVREYLDEVYRPLGKYKDGNPHRPGPWQTHTKRFLRHKAMIQGGRVALGFTGAYDEDEAERIIASGPVMPLRSGEELDIKQGEFQSGSRTENLAADLASRSRANVTDVDLASKTGDSTVVATVKDGKIADVATLKSGEGVDLNTGEIIEKPASTNESVRAAIEAAKTQEDLAPILKDVTGLPDTPERGESMRLWNARVMSFKTPTEQGVVTEGPKPLTTPAREPSLSKARPPDVPTGTNGWEKAYEAVIAEMQACKDVDALDVVLDRQGMVKWPVALRKTMQGIYNELRERLS